MDDLSLLKELATESPPPMYSNNKIKLPIECKINDTEIQQVLNQIVEIIRSIINES